MKPIEGPRSEASRLVDAINGITGTAGALLSEDRAEVEPHKRDASNIAWLVDQIYREPNPHEQYELRRVLLQAEDRFADRAWKLTVAERHIAESGARIERQRSLIARLHAAGHDLTEARRTLDNFILVQGLFKSFHYFLSQQLARDDRSLMSLQPRK